MIFSPHLIPFYVQMTFLARNIFLSNKILWTKRIVIRCRAMSTFSGKLQCHHETALHYISLQNYREIMFSIHFRGCHDQIFKFTSKLQIERQNLEDSPHNKHFQEIVCSNILLTTFILFFMMKFVANSIYILKTRVTDNTAIMMTRCFSEIFFVLHEPF